MRALDVLCHIAFSSKCFMADLACKRFQAFMNTNDMVSKRFIVTKFRWTLVAFERCDQCDQKKIAKCL